MSYRDLDDPRNNHSYSRGSRGGYDRYPDRDHGYDRRRSRSRSPQRRYRDYDERERGHRYHSDDHDRVERKDRGYSDDGFGRRDGERLCGRWAILRTANPDQRSRRSDAEVDKGRREHRGRDPLRDDDFEDGTVSPDEVSRDKPAVPTPSAPTEALTEEEKMQQMLGFGGFNSTKAWTILCTEVD
ncbi:hypothetical protein HDU82_009049 [Entophlyctis luteolus]|nr:hypothetical protein HDU82_009049 [Entophlyctis luteolus]